LASEFGPHGRDTFWQHLSRPGSPNSGHGRAFANRKVLGSTRSRTYGNYRKDIKNTAGNIRIPRNSGGGYQKPEVQGHAGFAGNTPTTEGL
jgi:hypothetical protein